MESRGKLVHVEHMTMRWGDMDALGHMNNAVYFRYLEPARISWFERLGAGYGRGEAPILGSIKASRVRCRRGCAKSFSPEPG